MNDNKQIGKAVNDVVPALFEEGRCACSHSVLRLETPSCCSLEALFVGCLPVLVAGPYHNTAGEVTSGLPAMEGSLLAKGGPLPAKGGTLPATGVL